LFLDVIFPLGRNANKDVLIAPLPSDEERPGYQAVVIVLGTGRAGGRMQDLPPPSVVAIDEGPFVWCLALSMDVHVGGNGAVTAFEPTTITAKTTTERTSTMPLSRGKRMGA
jgi:hypothetical protein